MSKTPTQLSPFDTAVRSTGIEKRGAVVVVTLGLWIVVALNLLIVGSAIASGNPATLVQVAGVTWFMSMLVPLTVMCTAAAFRRGPGAFIWGSLFASGLLCIAAPGIPLLAGVSSDTAAVISGKNSTAEISLLGVVLAQCCYRCRLVWSRRSQLH